MDFKLEERVLVQGLVSAAKYNGSRATVIEIPRPTEKEKRESASSYTQRFKIILDEGKELRIKKENLKLLTKEDAIQSFSISEIKSLLKTACSTFVTEGLDKSDLRQAILEKCSDLQILQHGKLDPGSGSPASSKAFNDLMKDPKYKIAAERMRGMAPDDLKAQIVFQRDMLKSNPAMLAQVIGQNPQLQGMSHEQVLQHLDMMANVDAEQLKMMANIDQKFNSPAASPGATGNMEQMQAAMQNMSTAQMKQMIATQRNMVKNNPAMFDQLRKSNPQMQNLTNEQIESQLEMMSSMSDSQLETILKMQQSAMSSGASAPSSGQPQMDMSKMDPKQMTEMLKMQKQMMDSNPEMFDKMMESNPMLKHMSKDQVKKQMDMMSDMSPEQLEKMMSMANKVQTVVQPIKNAYNTLDGISRGNAKALLLGLLAMFIGYLFNRWFL